jgi:hypothetical protein
MSNFCQQKAHFTDHTIEMKKYRYDKKMHKINRFKQIESFF